MKKPSCSMLTFVSPSYNGRTEKDFDQLYGNGVGREISSFVVSSKKVPLKSVKQRYERGRKTSSKIHQTTTQKILQSICSVEFNRTKHTTCSKRFCSVLGVVLELRSSIQRVVTSHREAFK